MAKTAKTTLLRRAPMDSRQLLTAWLLALATLIFAGGGWAWYQYVHRSTYGVFWDTIDNNLNIFGVTRTITQDNNGADFQQKLQISLGAENMARGLTTISQSDQNGQETTVITETLGTPTTNYARYTDIKVQSPDSKKLPDFSSVKNVWSRELLVTGDTQNQSVLAEGLFSSIPFARLSQLQRQELVQFMKDNKVYEVDYRGAKVVERAGKQSYEYEVLVNLEGYIETLKKIDEYMGLGQLEGVDPAAYAGSEPAKLTVTTSIDGRQLLEVAYSGSTRKEQYSSYGARISSVLPETDLLRPELEQRVQKIFTPQN